MRFPNSLALIAPMSVVVTAFILTNQLAQRYPLKNIELSSEFKENTLSYGLLQYTHLGFKRLVSGHYWMSTLINSDHQHIGEAGVKTSWMAHRFKLIAQLDPSFYTNYLFGGVYLGIIKDDVDSGIDLMTNGLAHFPTDPELHFQLGYMYLVERLDRKKALAHLSAALEFKKHGPLLAAVVANLQSSEGHKQAALKIVHDRIVELRELAKKEGPGEGFHRGLLKRYEEQYQNLSAKP